MDFRELEIINPKGGPVNLTRIQHVNSLPIFLMIRLHELILAMNLLELEL